MVSLKRAIGFVFILAILSASKAESQASPYVPLDDIAYSYIDALMARNALTQLSTLERPFTVRALREALEDSKTRSLSKAQERYMVELDAAISKYDIYSPGARTDTSAFNALIGMSLRATAQTSGRRDLIITTNDERLEPGGAAKFAGGYGPFVAVSRIVWDNTLNRDPDFAGRKDRKIAGRTDEAYISAQWKYAELFAGRQRRNWGPQQVSGLQLGSYPYSYDHFYLSVGPRALRLTSLVARLDNYVVSPGMESQRYFSIHRLGTRWRAIEAGISESYLYTGVGRGFEPSTANPLSVYALAWRNEKQEGNLNVGFDASIRTKRFGIWSTQLLLDDFQIDRCDPQCQEPLSYGVTFTGEGLPLFVLDSDQRWFFSYTRLSNLAYRTPEPAERYTTFNVGLGAGFSDFDEARVGLDLALIPYVPIKPYLAYRRQGEGSYLAPFPTPAQYASTPAFLSGIVVKALRFGVQGSGRLWPGVEAVGDVGVNSYKNEGHVAGTSSSRLEGRIRINIEPSWATKRLTLR